MTASSENASTSKRNPVLRAAIAWHMRLSEDPDDLAAQKEFNDWLADDPENASAWSHACRTMGLLEQGKSVAFLPKMDLHSPIAGLTAKLWWARRTWISSAVAAAIAVAIAPQVVLHWQADFTTGKGETRTVALSDGSTVRMAPGSAIAVRYKSGNRNVELLSGEAYFEVSPDRKRPFNVVAQSAQVTVLGTGFDVRLGEAGPDIAVRHGRVRVENAKQDYPFSSILTDGQLVRLDRNGRSETGLTAPANVGSWSSERLNAVGQPLREVIADLRRYHHGMIVLTDRSLGDRVVTGSYDVTDPAKAVETVVAPLGGRVKRITPWIILVSAG